MTLKNQATLIEMEEFSKVVINKMFEVCKLGIAFNILTTHVRHFASLNFYKNPLEIFAYCLSNLSLNVKIDHSYRLFEFTTYVYKSNDCLKNDGIKHLGYQWT